MHAGTAKGVKGGVVRTAGYVVVKQQHQPRFAFEVAVAKAGVGVGKQYGVEVFKKRRRRVVRFVFCGLFAVAYAAALCAGDVTRVQEGCDAMCQNRSQRKVAFAKTARHVISFQKLRCGIIAKQY